MFTIPHTQVQKRAFGRRPIITLVRCLEKEKFDLIREPSEHNVTGCSNIIRHLRDQSFVFRFFDGNLALLVLHGNVRPVLDEVITRLWEFQSSHILLNSCAR